MEYIPLATSPVVKPTEAEVDKTSKSKNNGVRKRRVMIEVDLWTILGTKQILYNM